MSDPLVEVLSRFTPDNSGLDHDALLFAAGRASVRPKRGWMALASVLATTQMLTLVLVVVWPQTTPPAGTFVESKPPQPLETPALPMTPEPSTIVSLRRSAVELEGDLPSSTVLEPVASTGSSLQLFSATRALLD